MGRCCYLQSQNRQLFYLVTKSCSFQKPNYEDLWKALCDLRRRLAEHGIRKVAMPKIGCGLDQLNWRKVRSMVESIFQGTGVDVMVCCYTPGSCSSASKTVDCYFHQTSGCRNGAQCRFRHGPVVQNRSIANTSNGLFRDATVLRRGQCNESVGSGIFENASRSSALGGLECSRRSRLEITAPS